MVGGAPGSDGRVQGRLTLSTRIHWSSFRPKAQSHGPIIVLPTATVNVFGSKSILLERSRTDQLPDGERLLVSAVARTLSVHTWLTESAPVTLSAAEAGCRGCSGCGPRCPLHSGVHGTLPARLRRMHSENCGHRRKRFDNICVFCRRSVAAAVANGIGEDVTDAREGVVRARREAPTRRG